jgi:integrase
MSKRRSPGEGGCWPYQTKAGELFRVKGMVRMPDGTLKEVNKRGFPTKTAGLEWLQDQQSAGRKGEYVEPSRQKLGAYGIEAINGMQVTAGTKASYRKNWRLHVQGYPIAELPLAHLAGVKLSAHYRVLEASGRKDHRQGEGLSPRTVRYVSQIIHGVLGHAVADGLLLRNPADASRPPSAKAAKAPEMHPWSAEQLGAFLGWAAEHSQHHALWRSLAYTGKRRGEDLSGRWRDYDLDNGTVAVRRSVGIVREFGEGAEKVEGDTKSGRARVIDLDAETVAVLKAWKRERGSMALQLVRDDALVFGTIEGEHQNPEHVSRAFRRDVERCRQALGADALPVIRLHDLRHTHATILLLNGVPVHVVSQRLGHSSPVITLTIYAHVMPGNQREAADLFARLVGRAGT